MTTLLLGKNGQVGRELNRTLLPFGDLIALSRTEYDLEDLNKFSEYLHKLSPDLIVNAAAYTAVDKAESDPERAYLINEALVRVLADYAQKNAALVVHYSTDYVFNGSKLQPYIESDLVDPQNVYGQSKAQGEQYLLENGCQCLIFRTSWVFSQHGHNFIKTILKLAKEKESLQVVSDQIGAPTSAELIADITAQAILAFRHGKLSTKLYHLTASGQTNWHELACYVVKGAQERGNNLTLLPELIKPIKTEDYPLPAKRPKYSVLDNTQLSRALNISMPQWPIYVDRLLDAYTKESLK